MVHADAYMHDKKARLYEAMPELAKDIRRRSKRSDIMLDSYIISATPYEDLRKKYDDGTWDKKRFTDAHILFLEPRLQYDYVDKIFKDQMKKSCV
jgi:hypothetical protein